jgi:hypothetical protein
LTIWQLYDTLKANYGKKQTRLKSFPNLSINI